MKFADGLLTALLVMASTSAEARSTTTADAGVAMDADAVRDTVQRALALADTDAGAARAMLLPLLTRDDIGPGLIHMALAKLALKQGDTRQADDDLKAGIAAVRPDGDAETRQSLVTMRATVAKAAGDDPRALRFAQVSTSMARKLDDPDRLRGALIKEGKYLTATSPKQARARLQEARALATGDPEDAAEIDELLATLPTTTTTTTTTTRDDDVTTPAANDSGVWGLGWGELIPLPLPLLYGVLMLVTARRRRSVLAHYETRAVLGLSAWSLIPVYGQGNLLGWRRALARRRDDEPLPSMDGGYGADGLITVFAIWGPALLAVFVLMFSFVLDSKVIQGAAAVAMLATLATTLLLEPVLHHVRDTHNVLPALQPMRVVQLLRRHPLQCLELIAVFLLNTIVMLIGNTWWIFGGTLATTVGAAGQGEAMHRFAARVVERDLDRERAEHGGTSVGGSPNVVPTFDVSTSA